MKLKNKQCVPCQGGVPPLKREEKYDLLKQLDSRWQLDSTEKKLVSRYKCLEFKHAIELAQRLADLADEQWHHPEILVAFDRIEIAIWTHKINDLVESDFIFAAKADAILD